MKSPILIYEDKPKIDTWFKALIVGIPALALSLGLTVKHAAENGTWVSIGTAAFVIVLFWIIRPRSYQIYQDRLVIKLGGPFAIDISLASINEAAKAPPYYAFGYRGFRFATSTKNVIQIKRHRGMNYIISPSNVDAFLEQLEQAKRTYPNP